MSYTSKGKGKQELTFPLKDHILRTREDPEQGLKHHDSILPPLQSKNLFMLHLIQQEEDTNKMLINRSGVLTKQANSSHPLQTKQDIRVSILNTKKMIQRPDPFFEKEINNRLNLTLLMPSPESELKRFPKASQTNEKPNEEMTLSKFHSNRKNNSSERYGHNSGSLAKLYRKSESRNRIVNHTQNSEGVKSTEPVELKKPELGGKTYSLQKIINGNKVIALEGLVQRKKDHIKTVSYGRSNKVELASYLNKIEECHIEAKKMRKMKMKMKPILTEDLPFKQENSSKVHLKQNEKLEPWHSQSPSQFDSAAYFLK